MEIQLHFIEQGEGEPLVLLHGNGGSGADFENQMEPFSAHFHVIAVDTRGHGQSPRGTKPFTLVQFADDLADFLTERGIEQASLLGYSDGGNIALLFALKYPQRVRRLVVNGANLYPSGMCVGPWRGITLAYLKTCVQAVFKPELRPTRDLLGLVATQPHIRPERLHALTMPTLVLAGTQDMIREAHTREIAAAIPGAELDILEGGHALEKERPEAFNARVLRFLIQHGA